MRCHKATIHITRPHNYPEMFTLASLYDLDNTEDTTKG